MKALQVSHRIVERFDNQVAIREGYACFQIGYEFAEDDFAVVATRDTIEAARERARKEAARG